MKLLKKKQMDKLEKAERRLLMAKMELIYGPDKTIENAIKQISEALLLIESVMYDR